MKICEIDNNGFYKIKNFSLNLSDVLGNADIFIWKFDNAPNELKEISVNGGDEDWLAVMTADFFNKSYNYIGFLENDSFGCCGVDKFYVEKYVVIIGSHA